MKYILIIGDGMADHPLEKLNGRTPLQVANHPNMDYLANNGFCGCLETIPQGFGKGTDVAIMSILGFDPNKYYTGRGPLEASSMGIKLNKYDIAFRCNLITVENDKILDYSAEHISTDEAKQLIDQINEVYGKEGDIEFYSGVSYRHILLLKGEKYSNKISSKPPHDVLNCDIKDILPKTEDKESEETVNILNRMIIGSKEILNKHPINQRRIKAGFRPANMIWPWGQGRKPNFQSFYDKYGIKSAVISAVDIVNGLGILAGMEIIKVPGATGFYDTNYEGKADYAIQSLNDYDFILIHVEAPDEASHIGDYNLKIRTIEDLDKRLLGRLLNGLRGDYTIAILPDHKTLTDSRIHEGGPVPFCIFSNIKKKMNAVKHFDENSIKNKSSRIFKGKEFIHTFLNI